MSHVTLHASGAEGEVVAKRPEWCQLQHHAEWLETDPYERDHLGVVKLTHDGQLLTEILVAVEEDVFGVLLSEDFYCYWLAVIGAFEYLCTCSREEREGSEVRQTLMSKGVDLREIGGGERNNQI